MGPDQLTVAALALVVAVILGTASIFLYLRSAGRFPLLVLAAGIVGVLRGVASIAGAVSDDLFGPVRITLALLLPVAFGLVFCLLTPGVARGSRPARTATTVLGVLLVVPFLLLGLLEVAGTFEEVMKSGSPPLGWLLVGLQPAALGVHEVLLVWVVLAGYRLRKRGSG